MNQSITGEVYRAELARTPRYGLHVVGYWVSPAIFHSKTSLFERLRFALRRWWQP